MPTSANYPAISPSLLLDFANTKALDPRITFSRPTTARYYDAKSSAVAEQNLLTYSQDFSNAIWAKSFVTITANSTTAPDGNSTASTLTSTSSGIPNNGVYETISAYTANGYTYSVYAKAGTSNFLAITSAGISSGPFANFNLSTGAVASSGSCTASITSVGSGWYRCVVANTSATGGGFFIVMPKDADPTSWGWTNGTCASGNYIYIWGAQLEQRSSATAYQLTTTAAITNYIPVLLTQQSNEARFDHNPTTRESLGLPIEEQRTNLQTYSSDFSNAVWTKSNSSVTADTIIAPDGTQTGDKWIPTTTGTISTTRLFATNTVSNATAYTSTIYVKYSGRRWVFMGVNDTSTSAYYCWFDVLNGVVGTKGASVTSTSITSVGNSWYRISATVTTSSTTNYFYISSSDADNSTTVTADSFSGLFIWGAQLEAGAFATSYIPTVASQVTRSADSASMTGTNFSSWYNNAEGSIYSEASCYAPTIGARGIASFDNGSGSSANTIDIRFQTQTGFNINYAGTAQAQLFSGLSTSANVFSKAVGTYKTNDIAFSGNANTVQTDSSATIPNVLARFNIGNLGNDTTNYALNGCIKKIAYYPIRVSNTALQSLTG
jgi:hypothetical protein